ncbi:MAG TPA: DUF2189 domain-containing protein [Candidatus Cybelea sp.]|nr:DUF2189 domain-containing protein [Candidatus Cybelea sp.]
MGEKVVGPAFDAEYAGLVLPINRIDVEMPWGWLRRGWQDMARAPAVSLGFGLVIALVSMVIIYGLWQQDFLAYSFPLAAGFMFVAPFLGIAFYEISRRLEMSAPLHFHDIAVAWLKRPGRIFSLGLIMMLFQVAWMRIATLLYALFFGPEPVDWQNFLLHLLTTTDGIFFLIVGSAVGAVLAGLAFAIGVVSFPLLLDRDVGTAQAIATSVAATLANWRVLLGWGALIVLFTAAGLVTGCLGLIVTMPLIGHASWHAYRDLVTDANG